MRRVLLLLFVILLLTEFCETKKKKGGTGKKGGKMKKKKGSAPAAATVVEESGKVGSVDKKPFVLAPHTPVWPAGGVQRTWSADRDLPQNNMGWNDIYNKMMYDVLENDYEATEYYFDLMEELLDIGAFFAYSTESTYISTILVAVVGTKNGTEPPPIIYGNQCTIEECLTAGRGWIPDTIQLETVTVLEAERPSELETLLDHFLAEYSLMSETFTLEETKRMLCREDYLETVGATAGAEVRAMTPEYDQFMSEAGTTDRLTANSRMITAHDVMGGKLLLSLIENLCNTGA